MSEDDRLAIAEILYAFLKRDYKLVASVHHRIGYIPKNTNLELFAQRCRAIAEPIIGKQIKNISKSFKNSLSECEIDKQLTMYSLRHLYTTRMVKRPDLPLQMICKFF